MKKEYLVLAVVGIAATVALIGFSSYLPTHNAINLAVDKDFIDF